TMRRRGGATSRGKGRAPRRGRRRSSGRSRGWRGRLQGEGDSGAADGEEGGRGLLEDRRGRVAAQAREEREEQAVAQPAEGGARALAEEAEGGGGTGDAGDRGHASALIGVEAGGEVVVAAQLVEEDGGVDEGAVGPLAEVGRHGVGGVAEQDEAAVDP